MQIESRATRDRRNIARGYEGRVGAHGAVACGKRNEGAPVCAGAFSILNPEPTNTAMITSLLPLAAIGWSFLYLLLGGGIFGAIVIFVVAKLFRK